MKLINLILISSLLTAISCVDGKKTNKKLSKIGEENIVLQDQALSSNSSSIQNSSTIPTDVILRSCLVYISSCERDSSILSASYTALQSREGEWSRSSCLAQASLHYNSCYEEDKDLSIRVSYYEDATRIDTTQIEHTAVVDVEVSSYCHLKINNCPADVSGHIPHDQYFYFNEQEANTNIYRCQELAQTLLNSCKVDETILLYGSSQFSVNGQVYQRTMVDNRDTFVGQVLLNPNPIQEIPVDTNIEDENPVVVNTNTPVVDIPTTPTTDDNSSTSWWKPRPVNSWDIRLDGGYSNLKNVDIYDVDLFDVPTSVIRSLHNKGTKVICYFSAGSYENWRSDKGKFSSAVKGRDMENWAGEKWLDIRRISELRSIMGARMDLAVDKGCDAVDPDNVDGYDNNSGFSLSYNDQIKYNKMLAEEAHKRGLAVGLKNDLEQVKDLEPYFDFAVNEECYSWNECSKLDRFIQNGKPVFGIEYELSTSSFCAKANSKDYDFLKKTYDLNSSGQACRN